MYIICTGNELAAIEMIPWFADGSRMVSVDPFSRLGFLFLLNNRAVAADSAQGSLGLFFISKPFSSELPKLVKRMEGLSWHPLFSCHWPYNDMVRYHLRPIRNILKILLFHRLPDWLIIPTFIIMSLGFSFGGHLVIVLVFFLD